jgi:hypothetical protein
MADGGFIGSINAEPGEQIVGLDAADCRHGTPSAAGAGASRPGDTGQFYFEVFIVCFVAK